MVIAPLFNLRGERDVENDSIGLVGPVRVITLDFHACLIINAKDARRARYSRV